MQSDLVACSFHTGGNFAKSVIWPATATELLIKKNTGLLFAEEGVKGKRKDQFFGVTQKC